MQISRLDLEYGRAWKLVRNKLMISSYEWKINKITLTAKELCFVMNMYIKINILLTVIDLTVTDEFFGCITSCTGYVTDIFVHGF